MKTRAPGGRDKAGIPHPISRTRKADGEGCKSLPLLLQTTHSHGELQQDWGQASYPKKSPTKAMKSLWLIHCQHCYNTELLPNE